MKKIIYITLVTFLTLFLSTASLNASNNQGGVVINLAGKQRMLTQKMSKEALLIAKGIEVTNNQKALKSTIALFEKTLKGLQYGDETLNLPKATNEKIIERIEQISKLWMAFKPFINKIADGKVDKTALKAVEVGNTPLLQGMDSVVKMFEKQYSSNLAPHMAKTINLAGRQRMLIQKMTKELLLIANNLESDRYLRSLKSGGKLFQTTLAELLNNKEVMENPQISKRLISVKKLWDEQQNNIANTELSEEGVKEFTKKEQQIIKKMDRELIEIAFSIDKNSYQKELNKTGKLFDQTLTALINGDQQLGVVKSDNREIVQQLQKVKTLWSEYKTVIFTVDVSPTGLKKALELNMPLLKEMDRAVKLYEIQ